MSVDDSMRRMIAEQHDEIGALKAENAKLRERIDDAHMSRLLTENENESLRELVRDMWFSDYAGHFSTLPELQDHQAAVWKRMRELGIEVS